MSALPRIAIATGDPAGIGPEISLKAALDPDVRRRCRPIVVGDPAVLALHAKAAGLAPQFRIMDDSSRPEWRNDLVNVLATPMLAGQELRFGENDPAYGRAALASAQRAIRAALDGEVEAVVAAPHNQTSIAAAGVPFDGYPSFVAQQTGLAPEDVFLMLCFADRRIVHCTLHVSVAEALAQITRERVARAIRATNTALRRLGIARPSIVVSGVNPHAGEGGLFGHEEIEIVSPAIADARATGIDVTGPFGADTMLHRTADAFLVMLHDQGHIPAKLLAPEGTAAMAIGSPILFSSVAHGSAFDIAGKGVASPRALVEAISRLAGAGATEQAA